MDTERKGQSVICQNSRDINVPAEMFVDDAVRFIAKRYRVTEQEVVRAFLVQCGIAHEVWTREIFYFRLEENEIEIMKGLMGAYCSATNKKRKHIPLWTEETF